uniref:Triosephosphate isomerase n=1 Tax=Fibrocapsa japonica TaxID=94617 RepID=A0A7S2XYZ2_9STRA
MKGLVLACLTGAAVISTVSAFFGSPLSYTSAMRSSTQLSMADRVPFICGNWKMNPTTLEEAKALAEGVKSGCDGSAAEVAIFTPHPFLYPVGKILDGSTVKYGGETVFFEDKGAYTGAVSASMLKTVGCEYVLAGHSERRVLFKTDDSAISRKVRKILDSGMKPVLCIGESREEYEANLNKEICCIQLAKDLAGVSAEEMKLVTIAYEPVWAIGTGLTATPEIAQNVHAYIRSWVAGKYGQEVADEVRIQYGGSVTPETVDELMACPDIDGALVGGASLDAAKFSRIVNFES